MNWIDTITGLRTNFNFKLVKPLSKNAIEAQIKLLGLNHTFVDFYLVTNGLTYEWFKFLPLEDSVNIKNTWDSLQKANDPNKTKFNIDDSFLERFVVFAEIGAGTCAVIDKSGGKIWYEEEGQLQETDLSLEEFIETCMREVDEIQ